MAGGQGKRFWPKSREAEPKQLIKLLSKTTLIEQTIERQLKLAPPENIFVITNAQYKKTMDAILPIPNENIIGEPFGRDTAPCVGLAAALVKAKSNDNAVMMLLPADHVIHNTEEYTKTMRNAAEIAQSSNAIVTIGINPTSPSTAYGYIECGEKIKNIKGTFYKSKGFKEKPNKKTAEEFLNSENFKWNAGMFLWSVKTITDALNKNAPQIGKMVDNLLPYIGQKNFNKKLEEEYKKQEKISIDYAVMEKAEDVFVAECTFDWDDVGSWTAVEKHLNKDENNNVTTGLSVSLNSKNNIIVGEQNHLIGLVDIADIVIVHTKTATLICPKKSAEKVKNLVQIIEGNDNMKTFL